MRKSVSSPDGPRCVDVFERPDGSFGFEEYRRDVEDPSGWFAIGFHASRVYDSEIDASAAAGEQVGWLSTGAF